MPCFHCTIQSRLTNYLDPSIGSIHKSTERLFLFFWSCTTGGEKQMEWKQPIGSWAVVPFQCSSSFQWDSLSNGFCTTLFYPFERQTKVSLSLGMSIYGLEGQPPFEGVFEVYYPSKGWYSRLKSNSQLGRNPLSQQIEQNWQGWQKLQTICYWLIQNCSI